MDPSTDLGRREHRRLEAYFEVLFSSLDDEGRRMVVGKAQNVSLGGIRFRTDRYLSAGDELEMEFRGEAFSRPFQAIGRIQRVERQAGGFEVGVRFLSAAELVSLENILQDYFRRLDLD